MQIQVLTVKLFTKGHTTRFSVWFANKGNYFSLITQEMKANPVSQSILSIIIKITLRAELDSALLNM